MSISTGGAGYNAINGKGGSGRVSIVPPPKKRPYPWPYPESAMQGSVGGTSSSMGRVTRPKSPYYSPFTQPYLGNWPWRMSRQGWLNLAPTCRN